MVQYAHELYTLAEASTPYKSVPKASPKEGKKKGLASYPYPLRKGG